MFPGLRSLLILVVMPPMLLALSGCTPYTGASAAVTATTGATATPLGAEYNLQRIQAKATSVFDTYAHPNLNNGQDMDIKRYLDEVKAKAVQNMEQDIPTTTMDGQKVTLHISNLWIPLYVIDRSSGMAAGRLSSDKAQNGVIVTGITFYKNQPIIISTGYSGTISESGSGGIYDDPQPINASDILTDRLLSTSPTLYVNITGGKTPTDAQIMNDQIGATLLGSEVTQWFSGSTAQQPSGIATTPQQLTITNYFSSRISAATNLNA